VKENGGGSGGGGGVSLKEIESFCEITC